MKEEGAVLLVVLVALALLASLAGVVARISFAEVGTLRAERAAFEREMLEDGALAVLGARLGLDDIAENGEVTELDLGSGQVEVRVQAASGLINPNFARESLLEGALLALKASPEQAARLTAAIVKARDFRDLSDMERLFKGEPELWTGLRPLMTLVGARRSLDPRTTPPLLAAAVAPVSAGSVDIAGLAVDTTKGFYELDLHVKGQADAADPKGKLWTHVTALRDSQGHMRVIARGWPAP